MMVTHEPHTKPGARRRRVIVDTDAKNEADDQFAIVHALLSPSLDVRGLVAAHFGTRRGADSMRRSRDEIDLVLRLMDDDGVRVADGAPHPIPDYVTAVDSPGARLIVEEALADDGPLYVAFLGPLTDMASALLLEPAIAERDITVIWIGGGSYAHAEPGARPEFNLGNDIVAANVVFSSALPVWQVPNPTYRMMSVGYAELREKVAPCGKIGEYLVRQLVEWNERYVDGPIEYRSLGDSPAIGLMLNPTCGQYTIRPAPNFTYTGGYDYSGDNRPIRVYDSIDARFIHEDFFAKLRAFAAGQ